MLRHLNFKPAPDAFPRERPGIERALEAQPGSHVVLVRYAEDHNPVEEWVYNKADIDGSKVIWARDMSPEEISSSLSISNAGIFGCFGRMRILSTSRRSRPRPVR